VVRGHNGRGLVYTAEYFFLEEQAVLFVITACKTQDLLLRAYYVRSSKLHRFSLQKLKNTPSSVCCRSSRHNFARERAFSTIPSAKRIFSSPRIDSHKQRSKRKKIGGYIDVQTDSIDFFTSSWLATFYRCCGRIPCHIQQQDLAHSTVRFK